MKMLAGELQALSGKRTEAKTCVSAISRNINSNNSLPTESPLEHLRRLAVSLRKGRRTGAARLSGEFSAFATIACLKPFAFFWRRESTAGVGLISYLRT